MPETVSIKYVCVCLCTSGTEDGAKCVKCNEIRLGNKIVVEIE